MSDQLVIIPAYNEEQTIAAVVREARAELGGADVLVINDGSIDDTKQRALEAGSTVLDVPLRLGIGGGVQTGYLYARRRGYKYVLRLDGDGQHPAAAARPLLELVRAGGADVAVGSRFIDGDRDSSTTAARRLGIRLFALMMRVLFSLRTTDPTSGLWAVGPAGLDALCSYSPDDFPEIESLAVCQRLGLKVRELPVRMRQRQAGRSSIGRRASLVYLVKVAFALFVISIRRYDRQSLTADLPLLRSGQGGGQ